MQSLQSQYTPKVLPPVPPDTPIILVHDHTQKTVLTTLYVNGDNELNFESIYKSIKSLPKHPTCSHRQSEDHWPCTPCAKAYSATFWEGACRLLDYFADFLIHDNGVMSGLWFYLLDIWQEMHVWFPCDAVLARVAGSSSEVTLAAALSFKSDFEATVELVDRVIHGSESRKVHREQLIHAPSGETRGPAGVYNTGPWVSGLTPWEQFLYKGSPGVAGFKKDEKDSVRYIPAAAISIIKTHTERARRLATQMNPDPEFLNHFDKNKLQFPQSTDAPSHLYKLLNNTTTTYRLVNGAPPIIRSPGFGDPNQTCSKQTLTLLDEFVGRCKGVMAYKPVSGDEDEHRDECMMAFDMWAISQQTNPGKNLKNSTVSKGWDEKFEELCKRSAS